MSQKFLLYSLYDTKAESYVSPFPAIKNDQAQLLFGQLLVSDVSPYYGMENDCLLFVVGEFDNLDGSIIPCQPRLISTGHAALEFLKAEQAKAEKSALAESASPSASADGNN